MAAKSTLSRSPRNNRASAKGASRRRRARRHFLLRWLFGFIRLATPRSRPELLALMLVLLALGTGVTLSAVAASRHQRPGLELTWCGALIAIALIARLAPWWQQELRSMTAERAGAYFGALLLLLVAVSVSWHLLSLKLGLGDTYLLPGALDRPPAAIIALVTLAILAVALLVGLPLGTWLVAGLRSSRTAVATAARPRLIEANEVTELRGDTDFARPITTPLSADATEKEVELPADTFTMPVDMEATTTPTPKSASLPPIDIFRRSAPNEVGGLDIELTARRIEETLASFKVSAKVVGHHSGPVVTQFDLQPDRGVKVRRITELQNDLALGLAAPTIRIQAPVPGKPFVGIEIPNSVAGVVTVRDLLESQAFVSLKSPLKVGLGKDVAGNPIIIDLTKLPHLLISGATGSGKSVCMNAILSSLLYQNTPDQVRLMIIDPKMVELTIYNGVPHLLSPVVTQMDKIVGVLQWALREMDRRYQLFANNGVRNIEFFNRRGGANLEKLPYIVIIVDELADLMMIAPVEVEDAVCRLAQLARAAGIHLVLATQRPSVDVVTGLIKANFPARIAFAMSSQVDSRTILDSAGAEKLLGRGDMLYMAPDAPKPVRLQGAYLEIDEEIKELVSWWQRAPIRAAVERIGEEEFELPDKGASQTEDELLPEAIAVVREYRHASVSLLQRRLRIGYARAARLIDQLESRGVVGAADGSRQRPVLDKDPSFVS